MRNLQTKKGTFLVNPSPQLSTHDSRQAKSAPSETSIVARLSTVGIAGNVILAAFKLFAGIYGNSAAMVSDAIHSISDVFATLVAYLGVRASKQKADDCHPYGHERFECLASLVLGVVLIVVACGIGWSGIERIASGDYASLHTPETIALIAALVSIVVKESMFWYTRHWAKVLNSSAFTADAWHHRSDALSSVGALIGIGAAMLGFPIADPIASIVICLLILKVAWDIMRDAVDKLLDTPCPKELEESIAKLIAATPGVRGIDDLRTRQFGNRVYVDAEIAVDGDLPLRQAHSIAESAHDAVERELPLVKHVMIHVNPCD